MKLPDIVNQFRRRASEGQNFARNPVQVIWRIVRKRGQNVYENAEMPGQGDRPNKSDISNRGEHPQEGEVHNQQREQFFPDTPSKNGAINQESLQINERSTYTLASSTTSLVGDRPDRAQDMYPLAEGEKLEGTWGTRYRVRRVLQHNNDWRYLYESVQEYSDEPVWIYVYVLSHQRFNQQEIAERKTTFEKLLNANLKLGHDRDFRILKIEDVFVQRDRRKQDYCYLVTKALPSACSLSDYLENNRGNITPSQVKQILQQILQSLKYLHLAYRVYWSGGGSEQGLYHGNLNLDSLWLRVINNDTLTGVPQFFIYVSNFALWEHLFTPDAEIATSSQDLADEQRDLNHLGWIAFSLLIGHKINPQDPQKNFDVEDPKYWSPQITVFKSYVLRLLGKGTETPFKTAEEADIALRYLDLSTPPTIETSFAEENDSREANSTRATNQSNRFKVLFLAILLIASLGGVFFLVLRLLSSNRQLVPAQTTDFCDINQCEIASIQERFLFDEQQPVKYAIETSSSWNNALKKSLTGSQDPNNIEEILEVTVKDLNLERQFPRVPVPQLSENLLPAEQRNQLPPRIADLTKDVILQELKIGNLDFALVQFVDGQSELIFEDFDFEVVGFDAIAFLVAFSDTNRPGSFPQRLNGEISLNSIRKIFTGKQEQISTAWQYEPLVRAFDTADSNLQGTNDQAREIQSVIADFKQLAFLSEQEYRQFESLLLRSNNQVSNIYEYLLAEFESQDPADPTITISFDRFSNMFAQCSVYPLAIRQGNTLSSLIIEANGDLITPETDLCDKGRYWANSAAFPITTQSGKQRLDREQAYPLATELAVIYPKCNVEKTEADRPCNAGQAFAQMLQTLEGQYLLQELELIPMVPIEQIRQNL